MSDNTMQIRKTLDKLDRLEMVPRDKISDLARESRRNNLEAKLSRIDGRTPKKK